MLLVLRTVFTGQLTSLVYKIRVVKRSSASLESGQDATRPLFSSEITIWIHTPLFSTFLVNCHYHQQSEAHHHSTRSSSLQRGSDCKARREVIATQHHIQRLFHQLHLPRTSSLLRSIPPPFQLTHVNVVGQNSDHRSPSLHSSFGKQRLTVSQHQPVNSTDLVNMLKIGSKGKKAQII